jgi:hypothetical protein
LEHLKFLNANGLEFFPGDEGEIIPVRLEQLTNYRDVLVRGLKPLINGFMKQLKDVHDL